MRTEPQPARNPSQSTVTEHGPSTMREQAAHGDSITGRLVQNGRPLAGAVMVLARSEQTATKELARTTTAADGSFVLPPTASTSVLLVHDERVPAGWQSVVQRSRSGENAAALGDLTIALPGVIEGIVRDRSGAPIAGAHLSCGLLSQIAEHSGQASPESTTDGRGRFRMARLPPGTVRLRCESPRHAILARHEVEITAGATTPTTIELRAGVTLRGVVRDWQGQPLASAEVQTENGRRATSDANGQFEIVHFRKWTDIHVQAAGHVAGEWKHVHEVRFAKEYRLSRAVTLRGVVHGSNGLPGTVRIVPASQSGIRPRPDSLLHQDLDVVRNGRFEVIGLSCADFELVVHVPGAGEVGPIRVELRDDTEIECTLLAEQRVTIVLQDAEGAPIPAARLYLEPRAHESPSRYRPGPHLLGRILRWGARPSLRRDNAVSVTSGEYCFGHTVGEALAFAVEADGRLSEARGFAAGEAPNRITVQLAEAGGVRGKLRGGSRTAYGTSVWLWPISETKPTLARNGHHPGPGAPYGTTREALVRPDGSFSFKRVAPGDYQATLSRTSTRRPVESNGIPVIDTGVDLREVVAVTVTPGGQSEIVLSEPPQGVLRGRVFLRGAPVGGVAVAATRPVLEDKEAKRPHGPLDMLDWDDNFQYQFASGQLTEPDGSFRMLFRDAGPVELRLRHLKGHATSAPILVVLPQPADEVEVVRDLHLDTGEIRGRVPEAFVAEKHRKNYRITLFRTNKASCDPFFFEGDFSMPVSWNCQHVKAPTNGLFRFSYLPAGPYVVRVHTSGLRDTLLWQKAVKVQGDVVDLGMLEQPVRVRAAARWQWRGSKPERAVGGAWLWQELDGDPQGMWQQTAGVVEGALRLRLQPGRYTLVPFFEPGYRGMSGMSHGLSGPVAAAAVAIEVNGDGSVTPEVLTFAPIAEGGRGNGEK